MFDVQGIGRPAAGRADAVLPAGTTAAFINLEDAQGRVVSGDAELLPAAS